MGRKLKDVHLLNIRQGRRKLILACKQPVESSLLPYHLSLICRLFELLPFKEHNGCNRRETHNFLKQPCVKFNKYLKLSQVWHLPENIWCVCTHNFWVTLKFWKECDDANWWKFKLFKWFLTSFIPQNGLHICCNYFSQKNDNLQKSFNCFVTRLNSDITFVKNTSIKMSQQLMVLC